MTIGDPLVAFRFKLEVDNVIQAGFSECSGLQVETEVDEVREGGNNEAMHKLPKGQRQMNLSLRRGMTDSRVLWDWHLEVARGRKVPRKLVNVVLLDRDGEERWRWSFKEAFPVKWTGPELKGDGNAVAIETLELAHGGFEVMVPKQ
jgi:phage tail-like protein